MSSVKKNTIANYAGQGWAALMSIAFVPIYIRYIGIEAYGIIGFFVALQSLFSILDMGLATTLNRELARRSSGGPQDVTATRDLVRTMEWFYWPIAILIGLIVWAFSGVLAEHWLRPVSLSLEQTATALFLLGLATAFQWPVSFYTGGLSGLQRQVLLNVMGAAFATLRSGGAVGVLWLIAPTIEAFLWWHVTVSATQSVVYAALTWRALPASPQMPVFSLIELRKVGRFAIGVTGVTIVSFLLTQSDRIVLSKLLTLDEFGIYAFAASLALVLFRLIQPIFAAVYPRYSQLVAANDFIGLTDFYHRTNQLMSAIVLPVATVIAVFAEDIVRLWTSDTQLAAASAPILSLLVAASAISGLLNLPYALQLAYGWTRLSFWVNVVAVCFVVPATWVMGQHYGGVGAAIVWLALQLGYFFVGIPLMHRRLLPNEKKHWYMVDVAPPLVASATMVLLWRTMFPIAPSGIHGWMLLLVVAATTTAASIASSPFPRRAALDWLALLRPSNR